jgi:farnesyl diphosphate synthase
MAQPADARPTLARRLAEAADLVTVALDELLPRGEGGEARLTEAMRYAVLGPGQRIRPYFALEASRLFDVEERSVLRAACALECVYAASLVHDDLPSLDKGDVRRGRPTVHRQYDEATAVLVGDALQSIAFEILAHPDTHEDGEVRAALVYRLARAAGAKGMAGGRMIDVAGVGSDPGPAVRKQRMKTGALISFAFDIPLVIARPAEARRQALRGFAQDLGIAYRVADDLLDVRPAPDLLRRAAGRESKARPAEAGLAVHAPQERVALLSAQCKAHLDIFGAQADYLRECVDFVLDRRM